MSTFTHETDDQGLHTSTHLIGDNDDLKDWQIVTIMEGQKTRITVASHAWIKMITGRVVINGELLEDIFGRIECPEGRVFEIEAFKDSAFIVHFHFEKVDDRE